jgi:hypothetical protein
MVFFWITVPGIGPTLMRKSRKEKKKEESSQTFKKQATLKKRLKCISRWTSLLRKKVKRLLKSGNYAETSSMINKELSSALSNSVKENTMRNLEKCQTNTVTKLLNTQDLGSSPKMLKHTKKTTVSQLAQKLLSLAMLTISLGKKKLFYKELHLWLLELLPFFLQPPTDWQHTL